MYAPSRTAIVLLCGSLLAAVSGLAMARPFHEGDRHETRWEHRHPWRDQVNDRLARQRRRIRHERREGELTAAQAQALHGQDRAIRSEERAIAAQNHGAITRAQQEQLNQQENQISSQIGR